MTTQISQEYFAYPPRTPSPFAGGDAKLGAIDEWEQGMLREVLRATRAHQKVRV
ncbi:hypothetical protein B9479_008341, partial [Cryptococcus floricola]